MPAATIEIFRFPRGPLAGLWLALAVTTGMAAGPVPSRTETAIAYKPAEASGQANRCFLDIHYPENQRGFATVIWFHGGGLTAGERAIPEAMKNTGIAVVAPSYRLSPQTTAPGYIEDAAAATAWVFTNIARYGGSPEKIHLSGHSAGAYLACMVGMDKKFLAKHGIDAGKIAGIESLSGQMITHFTIRKERGIPDTTVVVDEFAPLFHVRKDLPSLLLLTGDREKEMLGRYEENAYFWRMLKVAGHQDVELVEIPGADHGTMLDPAIAIMLKRIHPQAVEPAAR